MKQRTKKVTVSAGIGLAGLVLAYAASSQGSSSNLVSKVTIQEQEGKRILVSNGIPDHSVGRFPNRFNPNRIKEQSYKFSIPITPTERKAAAGGTRRRPGPPGLFGVALNGVPFEPGTGEIWNNDFRYHYEALSGQMVSQMGSLGMDSNNAHVQPTGAYHYHGIPYGYLEKRDYKNKPTLIGYAADGYPIYGPFGYAKANDAASGMKELRSSYRLKSGSRPSGDGPQGVYDGSFASDYEYVEGLGDLDQFNGRFGVTPEYPNGTFYYVISGQFPFVSRQFKGVADPSFQKRDMPPGGPGGPGGGFPGGPPPFPPDGGGK